MITILRGAPAPPTARVYLRRCEVAILERRVASWTAAARALLPHADSAETAGSIRLQALARVVDLPTSVLFGERIEVRVIEDDAPLPGIMLTDNGKPLQCSGRFERVEAPRIVVP